MQGVFTITGMTCGGCVQRVQAALAVLGSAKVTLDPPRAEITSEGPVTAGDLNVLLAPIGAYRAEASHPMVPAASSRPDVPAISADTPRGWLETYRPLIIIVGLITLVAIAAGRGSTMAGHGSTGFSVMAAMNAFMAGFFLVFGGFKLFDLNGFADAYATYDLLAARWRAYGLLYPFLELALGTAYLFGLWPEATNWATLLLMGFSTLGVVLALRRGQAIRCACLGTSLNLPMSSVTLVEDLAMVTMAVMMLAR
jgi:copper chaperone CopZ